jgi:hypothetical protein
VLALIPVPILTAVISLILAARGARSIRLSMGRLKGNGQILAARILSVVNIAVSLLLIVVVAFNNNSSQSPTGGAGGQAIRGDAYDQVVQRGPGTCFDDLDEPDVTECSAPHEAEFYGNFQFPASDWPGDTAVADGGEERCVQGFEDYTGSSVDESTELDVYTITPSRDGWNAGDREVICVLTSLGEGKLTGSKRSSA